MILQSLELSGFKSFAKKTTLTFDTSIAGIVGPNGSGKSNVVEAIRFVLGEQSMKSLRGKGGTDLIFKGSRDLSALSRASVTIVFNNQNRIFQFTETEAGLRSVDFDEVRITREVYSDGGNRYLINGSEVRLKDIIELLASVHIGASGHHIISQGEADRILSSSNKDRRIIIEDALGLKVYQYRIKESERRLEKTEQNMKEVGSLRRELAPHLNFLKKQVEKIEKAKEIEVELVSELREYISIGLWLREHEASKFGSEISVLKGKLEGLKQDLERKAPKEKTISPFEEEKKIVNDAIFALENKRNSISHEIGRVEGMIDGLSRMRESFKPDEMIPRASVVKTLHEIKFTLSAALSSGELQSAILHIQKALTLIDHFDGEEIETTEPINISELESLKDTKRALLESLSVLDDERVVLNQKKKEITEREQVFFEGTRAREREYYEIRNEYQETQAKLSLLENKKTYQDGERKQFEEYIQECVLLLGSQLSGIVPKEPEDKEQIEEIQQRRHKQVERLRIKFEESGALGGNDTVKEYEETLSRDQFLEKELTDLSSSIGELKQLILDLKEKLDTEFKEGVTAINAAFQEFFALMFGGGSAHLRVTVEQKRKRKTDDEEMSEEAYEEDEEESFERGIEISVSLPHKKVRELSMLSGGERSLVSIALLFAMSQVNPPPFLVLDETDAALDEANSRRYGDMIERLAKYSQLILVTHNRETMSRAQILYGVTLGADGGSKLLSIKFDDAQAFAK